MKMFTFVNKKAFMDKQTIGIELSGFGQISSPNFTFGFHRFHIKQLKIIQYDF